MADNVEIVYFIEHVARELDVACAIKAILESENRISVKLASITHEIEDTIANGNPKVVLLPQCNGVINRSPEKMLPSWPNAKYINLSYEQVLGKAQLDYMSEKDEFTRNFIIHSVWGNFYEEILIKTGVRKKNIIVNGSPTLDLYRPPYNKFYPQEKRILAQDFGLSPEKRWVFIPENYGWAFFHDKLIRDRINRGFDPEHAYQYREFALESLKLAAEWWCGSDGSSGFELIIRPRPATPECDFRKKLDELGLSIPQHLHIIKDGSVREWIMASDIVMSSYSTTLLEAAVFHKPVYMMTPVPLPEFLYSEWYECVQKIFTQHEFDAVCSGDTAEQNWQDAETWIDQLYLKGDAIQNIAEMVKSLLNGSVKVDPPILIAQQLNAAGLNNFSRKSRKSLWKIYQAALMAMNIQTTEQKRQAHEKDHFSQEIVDAKVEKWVRVLGL